MRRNDIEQRRNIQRHNEQMKRQQIKRQEEALQGSILTPSIKNFNPNLTGDHLEFCINCNNGIDSSNISDVNEGIIILK